VEGNANGVPLMDNVTIKATVASSSITGGVRVVGFADADPDPSAYLTLQRDVSLSEDQNQKHYYLELSGQQYGVYGGILECEISCAKLLFTLDPRQTRISAKSICVLNSTNGSQWTDACRAVELLFEGTGVAITSSDT
jgi:hypothetical protein